MPLWLGPSISLWHLSCWHMLITYRIELQIPNGNTRMCKVFWSSFKNCVDGNTLGFGSQRSKLGKFGISEQLSTHPSLTPSKENNSPPLLKFKGSAVKSSTNTWEAGTMCSSCSAVFWIYSKYIREFWGISPQFSWKIPDIFGMPKYTPQILMQFFGGHIFHSGRSECAPQVCMQYC